MLMLLFVKAIYALVAVSTSTAINLACMHAQTANAKDAIQIIIAGSQILNHSLQIKLIATHAFSSQSVLLALVLLTCAATQAWTAVTFNMNLNAIQTYTHVGFALVIPHVRHLNSGTA